MAPSTSSETSTPGGGIPAAPLELREWLERLTADDPVQHARQFHAGLEQIVRQPRSAGDQLEMLDGLYPHVRTVTRELRAAARGYPLSAEARETVQLNQSILAEMVGGYGRALETASGGETVLTAADRARAIHRAVTLCNERLLTAALVYAPTPAGLWRDLHRLFRMAEHAVQLHSAVAEAGAPGPGMTIVELYLHAGLLALARPQSLRQRDIARLPSLFARGSHDCTVSNTPSPDRSMSVYYIDTLSDAPPDYRDLDDVPASPDVRYLNLAPLLAALKNQIRGAPAGTDDGMPAQVELCREVLENLTTYAKRQFSRAQRNITVFAAVGLDGIHRALSDDADATGSEPESWQSWQLLDLSAGGYCLLRRSSAAPEVRVGELMAVREQFNDEYLWRIGVIRWMRWREDRALETGIQLLAPRATPVLLRTAASAQAGPDTAIKALMLPPVRSIDQPPTLLVPPNRLRPGGQMLMALHAQERRVRLGGIDGQSDCFSQFRYSSR